MLVSLSIRDIVLIEELDIEFSSGFSVLTGETGAGKSILLGAFSFVLGGKGNASLVRQGKQQGEVIAVFKESQNHPVHSLLEKNSFKSEVKIILKRVQLLDGRTRSFINDKPVGLGLVRLIGSSLAEIHGQHDDRAFVDSLTHRDLLDSFGGYAGAYENCRVSWKNWRESKEQLRLHRIEMEAAMREEDYFRSSLDELEKLDSKPGEEEALATLRLNMMNAEKIVSDIKDLYENLTGDYSPSQKILSSLRPLQRRTGSLPSAVEEIVHILEQALLALDSACVRVESTLNEIAYDSVQLEKTEERLFALRAAGRKYNKSPDTLNELRDKLIHDLRKIDNGQELLKQLEKKEIAMSHIYEECSARLSFLRHQAAQDLCSSVLSELPALKLESSDFLVDVVSDSSQPSESGIDRVEFKIRTSPTTNYGSMMKIASGGELSRFLLALKVALAQRVCFSVLIFDEIDTGVSGAVADAMGQRLLSLSQSVQVLAVTHAPQIAASADSHFIVLRNTPNSSGPTIQKLDFIERREEIARMLAGACITDEARAAASRLLSEKAESV